MGRWTSTGLAQVSVVPYKLQRQLPAAEAVGPAAVAARRTFEYAPRLNVLVAAVVAYCKQVPGSVADKCGSVA